MTTEVQAHVRLSEVLPEYHHKEEAYQQYELDQSESITFLYGLLYDDNASLSKSDILSILTSLKNREETLPFSFGPSRSHDVQGVCWPRGIKRRFMRERQRVGTKGWFRNISGAYEMAYKNRSLTAHNTLAEFYKFHKFNARLKLHITHFQLRNLVCCAGLSKGIYYPANYYSTGPETYTDDPLITFESSDPFFKVNRLAYDNYDTNTMKLDCIIDSKTLSHNTNSRISTIACSNQFLVTGTFEGSYILTDISDMDQYAHLGEHELTSSIDGITNSIIIKDDKDLIVSSNDQTIRHLDLDRNVKIAAYNLGFSANCLSMNPFNWSELFICGDTKNTYVHDMRTPFTGIDGCRAYKGQEDFAFSCDWSPVNENLLLAGNQDGCVRLWDRRVTAEPLHCFSGSLGSSIDQEGTVRNTKFSRNGDYVCWAESLDHVGLLKVSELNSSHVIDRVQSIEFVGKCTGLSFSEADAGHGEALIIGVYDSPLGGILSYNLESSKKTLDFDFDL